MPKKQKDGRYRAQIKVGVDANGKDIVKYYSGRTLRELQEAKERTLAHYIDGAERPRDRLFGDYAVEWYTVHKKPEIKESQQGAYRTMLNKHILPALGDRNLRAITSSELQDLLNTFAGRSKSQITMALAVLQGVFGFAAYEGIIERDPSERLKKPDATPPKERRALTQEERQKMVEIINTQPRSEWLAIMYYTGMRPGEARGLQWGDIDWEHNMIHVQRDMDNITGKLGTLKTAAADRYVPMVADLRSYLWPKRDLPAAPVAPDTRGMHLSQASAQRLWIRLMLSAGYADKLPEGSTKYQPGDIRGEYRATIPPYLMRHNYITMCWENGIDVQLVAKIVGHTDISVTMRTYTHLDNMHIVYAKNQFENMFARSNPAETLPEALGVQRQRKK